MSLVWGTWDLWVTQLTLESGKEEVWVTANVGAGDSPLFFAKENRETRLVVGIIPSLFDHKRFAADEDKLGEFSNAQLIANDIDVLAPVVVERPILRDSAQTFQITEPISTQGFDLKDKEAGGGRFARAIHRLSFEDHRCLLEGKPIIVAFRLREHESLKGSEVVWQAFASGAE